MTTRAEFMTIEMRGLRKNASRGGARGRASGGAGSGTGKTWIERGRTSSGAGTRHAVSNHPSSYREERSLQVDHLPTITDQPPSTTAATTTATTAATTAATTTATTATTTVAATTAATVAVEGQEMLLPATTLSITVTKSRMPKKREMLMQHNVNTTSHLAQDTNNTFSVSPSTSGGGVASRSSSSSSPPLVSIVGIGERKGEGQQHVTTTPRSRLHPQPPSSAAAGGKTGRLSQGWSPPQQQQIGPLRGNPIHASPRRGGGAGEGSEVKDVQKSPTSSMILHVNVNEFLTDSDRS